MKKKNILICFDRDGCLINDNARHPGHTKNWKREIKIRSQVVSSLKFLNRKLPKAKICMVTNQTGIAIADLPLLTKARATKVDNYIIQLLKKRGAIMHSQFLCPYVPKSYAISHPHHKFIKSHIRTSQCRKPNTGMIKQALRKYKFKPKETSIYMLGDRLTDVQTALNIKGFGILTPFFRRPLEAGKVKKLKNKNTYISKDFRDACEFIVKRELK